MTHSVHQVLETKDFQAAAKVIENLFTIDIPQNEETGPEERVWSAPAVSLASRVCSSASVCVVCVWVGGWVFARARPGGALIASGSLSDAADRSALPGSALSGQCHVPRAT